MWILRNDALVGATVLNADVLLLLLQPFQHVGHLLAPRPLQFELEAKPSRRGIGYLAGQLSKVAEVGIDPVADPADERNVDQHAKRRNPARPAREFAKVAVRIIAICEAITAANDDVDGTLFQKLARGHSTIPAILLIMRDN